MAKLTQLPTQAVIDGLAGVLDFYVYHPVACQGEGVPCVRKWPTYTESRMTQAAKDARIPFGYVNTTWNDLDLAVQQAWNDMAGQTALTGKDLSVRGYLNGDSL